MSAPNRMPERRCASVRDMAAVDNALQSFSGDRTAVLTDFHILDAAGLPFQAGEPCGVLVFSQALFISPGASPTGALLGRRDLLQIEVGGPGIIQRGGGFVGGGLGVVGAIEGMAIAGILNRLTTRTKIQNVVHIIGETSSILLHNSTMNPSALQSAFAPLAARAARSPQTGEGDLSSQLRSLSELHTAGALTDDEFRAAKAKLLGT